MTALPQLISLLHLASPALPIGGFSYSQGLEAAIDCGMVRDAATAEHWIRDNLVHVQAQCEAPVWLLLHRAWRAHSRDDVSRWNDWFHVTRETSELRLETEQMGWSLAKLSAANRKNRRMTSQSRSAVMPVSLPSKLPTSGVAGSQRARLIGKPRSCR